MTRPRPLKYGLETESETRVLQHCLCTFEIGFILLLFLGLRLLKAFPSETWPMSSMHLWTLTDKSCFNVIV